MAECIDNEARTQAGTALTKIAGHEGHCGERYAQINVTLTRLHERIDKVIALLVTGLGGISLMMAGAIIAYLLGAVK